MREPPDPLRHSLEMNLDLADADEFRLAALKSRLRAAQRRGAQCESREQGETAGREQAEAHQAIDDFWRGIAAEQVEGAADELRAWNAWRASSGAGTTVRVELGGA